MKVFVKQFFSELEGDYAIKQVEVRSSISGMTMNFKIFTELQVRVLAKLKASGIRAALEGDCIVMEAKISSPAEIIKAFVALKDEIAPDFSDNILKNCPNGRGQLVDLTAKAPVFDGPVAAFSSGSSIRVGDIVVLMSPRILKESSERFCLVDASASSLFARSGVRAEVLPSAEELAGKEALVFRK